MSPLSIGIDAPGSIYVLGGKNMYTQTMSISVIYEKLLNK